MPIEIKKEIKPFTKEIAGMRPDDGDRINIPGWLLLQNLWLTSNGKLRTRPNFAIQGGNFSTVNGLGISHDNKLVYAADNKLYINGSLKATIQGTSFLKVDVSRSTTIITTGVYPIVWEGTATKPLNNLPNTYSLATFTGIQKLRLATVSSNDPRKIIITSIGNLDDTGKIITDSLGINDEKTEGHYIKNIPYEITDLIELNGSIFIFTKQAIYLMQPVTKEFGFSVQLVKALDIEVWPGKVAMVNNQMLFLNTEGIYLFTFTERSGPGLEKIEADGIEKEIRASLSYDQTRLSFDKERQLIYLVPNNTDNITWVYNIRAKHWTKWTLPIIDTATLETDSIIGGTFAASKLGILWNIGVLADDALLTAPIEIILKSGLNSFENELSRKVFKRIILNITARKRIDHFMDLFTDEIPDIPLQPLITDPYPFQILTSNIMKKGKRGCLYIKMNAYSELIIDDITVLYYEKPSRIGIRTL